MNDGKICVSICAPTIEEFVQKIRSATDEAELLELRFDFIEKGELNADERSRLQAVLSEILAATRGTPVITTFRPEAFGGGRSISSLERENFWNIGCETDYADLEPDIVAEPRSFIANELLCSFHDFDGVPPDIEAVFRRLAETGVAHIKIAAQVDRAEDAVPLWKLLDLARKHGKRAIPVAMGEAGKWTRILGLAYGASITYASPDEAHGTAPGQITATDLRDVFNVKELDTTTDVYGVIAGNTSYSLSPYMHNPAFRQAGLNSVFVPLQTDDVRSFFRRMVDPRTREIDLNFRGFAITNPHKQTVFGLLNEIEPTARRIGAVNTVKIDGDRAVGFNTDAPGFIDPLQNVLGDLRDAAVAVVGAGGAARACVFALNEAGANVTLFARDPQKAADLAAEFALDVLPLTGDKQRMAAADILVNATPAGTRGEHEHASIATADELCGVKLVYDLVYNPRETLLIKEAKRAGVRTLGGLDMLIAQGAKQFEIWTGREAPIDVMRRAIEKRLG